MLALVVVILMVGTITSTSSALKSEIEGMIGWYERANIADNMLDVLTKSPGEPDNWTKKVFELRSIGIASNLSPGVSFKKVLALEELAGNNDPHVARALTNLSLNKDFSLMLITGRWDVFVKYAWNPEAGGGNFDTYNTDCKATIKTLQFSNPTVIECNPLSVTGTASVTGQRSLCIMGELDAGGNSMITVNSGYLAVKDDFKITGSSTTTVHGDMYIWNKITVLGGAASAKLTIYGNLFVFGYSEPPLIDLRGSVMVTIYGIMYLQHDNIWYAVTGDWTQITSWYKWTGSSWESLNETEFSILKDTLINVVGSSQININLNNLPLDNNFEITPPGCWEHSMPLSIETLNATYVYPKNISSQLRTPLEWDESFKDMVQLITIINGTFESDLTKIDKSMERSPWIEVSKRSAPMIVKEYKPKIEVKQTELKRIIAGEISSPVLQYQSLRLNVSGENGYAIFVIRVGDSIKALGLWNVSGYIGGALWNKVGDNVIKEKEYSTTTSVIEVPWDDLIPARSWEKGEVDIEIWVYKSTLNKVTLTDSGALGAVLLPKREMVVLKVWVWDDS